MKAVSEEVWSRWLALVQPLANVSPAPPRAPGVVGQLTSSGRGGCIEEYVEPRSGEVVARRVRALGHAEFWLRSDQIAHTVALAAIGLPHA